MRINPFLIGALCVVVPLQTVPASARDMTAAYAASDEYGPGKLGALITDLNLRARFVADDTAVLFCKGEKGQGKLLLADTATGNVRELTTEAALAPKIAAALGTKDTSVDITPRDYDPAKDRLSFSASGKNWTYMAGALSEDARPQTKPAGVLSPDGKLKVIVRAYNLYLVEVATGREVALTADGDYDRRYGMNYPLLGNMAAAGTETPDMPVSVQWSADSKRILTYRLSRNGSYIWHAVQQNPPGSHFPRTFAYVYPTAGAKDVPQFEPILIDAPEALKAGQGRITALEVPAQSMLWPGDPSLYWDGDHILYEWQKRGYGQIDLFEIDPATAKATLRVREALTPAVTVTSSFIRPAPELGGYLNVSERSGWAQLYFIRKGEDPTGGKALTKGNWEVTGVERVGKDEPLLVTGIGREAGVNPYFRSLYAVTLEGAIKNLTPEPLDHRVEISGNGKWLIDRMSSPLVPTRTVLRDAKDGRIVAELGRADATKLLATGFTPPEPFETTSEDGKVKLYGMIHRPKNFDPSRSYPVIENVYTGPTTHRFSETWDEAMTGSVNAVAQLGAIVVTIDGRGTSQRGRAFRMPAWQNLGDVGIDDHIWVLKAMKAKYGYFDLSKVGVYGGSAGGYDTARFVLRRPDFYKVGVASSGNHDLRLDKAWWPEVSMGVADDATWERNSNNSVAANLKGKLMLIHGDVDDNVPVTASLRLDAALNKAGKPHELVILPNTTHNVYQPYYWRKLRDYFTVNLLGETPPAQ